MAMSVDIKQKLLDAQDELTVALKAAGFTCSDGRWSKGNGGYVDAKVQREYRYSGFTGNYTGRVECKCSPSDYGGDVRARTFKETPKTGTLPVAKIVAYVADMVAKCDERAAIHRAKCDARQTAQAAIDAACEKHGVAKHNFQAQETGEVSLRIRVAPEVLETALVALLEAGVPVQTEDEAHAEWLARQEAK